MFPLADFFALPETSGLTALAVLITGFRFIKSVGFRSHRFFDNFVGVFILLLFLLVFAVFPAFLVAVATLKIPIDKILFLYKINILTQNVLKY